MACRDYDEIDPDAMRWVLVEAAGRILPEVSASLGRYTVDRLRERGIEVLLETRLLSCVDGHVELTDGQRFEADTVVWTAGVRANPALSATDLPLDESGRVVRTQRWRFSTSRTRRRPATTPPCPISPDPATCAAPAPSTPAAKHA